MFNRLLQEYFTKSPQKSEKHRRKNLSKIYHEIIFQQIKFSATRSKLNPDKLKQSSALQAGRVSLHLDKVK